MWQTAAPCALEDIVSLGRKKNVRQSTRQGVVYLPEKLTRVDPLRIKNKFMFVAFRGWHLTCVTNARGGVGEITNCDC